MDKIALWKTGNSSITPYLLDDGKEHAAILVIPGGGYGCVCESTEGGPIARKFNALGYHCFVLDYRCAPDFTFPAPQQDAMRAMRLIRGDAAKFRVIPDRIAALGFSAGGHLAASIGTSVADEVDADAGDKFDAVSSVPDALLLGYAVLSLESWSNVYTGKNLLGARYDAEYKRYSLENRVTVKTPPAFLWQTLADQSVAYRNSILFAEALHAAGVPCELHIFPYGNHGMLLGYETLDVIHWPEQADAFLQTQWLARADKAALLAHYTNPYQAEQEKLRR